MPRDSYPKGIDAAPLREDRLDHGTIFYTGDNPKRRARLVPLETFTS